MRKLIFLFSATFLASACLPDGGKGLDDTGAISETDTPDADADDDWYSDEDADADDDDDDDDDDEYDLGTRWLGYMLMDSSAGLASFENFQESGENCKATAELYGITEIDGCESCEFARSFEVGDFYYEIDEGGCPDELEEIEGQTAWFAHGTTLLFEDDEEDLSFYMLWDGNEAEGSEWEPADGVSLVVDDFLFETSEQAWFFINEIVDDEDDDDDDDESFPACYAEGLACILFTGSAFDGIDGEVCEELSAGAGLLFEFQDGCPEGNLATCVHGEGSSEEAIILYYSGLSLEDAEEDCESDEGTFYESDESAR